MGRQTRLTVGTVMSLLAFDFIAPAFPFFEEPWGMLAMWGVIVGQVNLIATWGALGPGNVVIRLPWSILLGVLTCCALALGLRAWRWGVAGDDFVALMGPVILGGVVVAQIPLWIAGRCFRWRLINLEDGSGDSQHGPFQFNVRHMILVMFLVALALGSAQLVLPSPDFAGLYHLGGESVVILGAIVVTNLVMTVPCIWGALVKSNPVPLLAWPVYCAFVTAIEFTALCFLLGPPGADSREVFMAFLLFNVLQCATVYFVLRLFRAVGFRLVRVAPT